jgi:hypothetical protein
LGEDAIEQLSRGLGPGEPEHLQPGGSTLGIGHHAAAGDATEKMEIEGGLIGGGESAVERVREHSLALGAVLGVARLGGLGAAELIEVLLVGWHLNHLPFYTL